MAADIIKKGGKEKKKKAKKRKATNMFKTAKHENKKSLAK